MKLPHLLPILPKMQNQKKPKFRQLKHYLLLQKKMNPYPQKLSQEINPGKKILEHLNFSLHLIKSTLILILLTYQKVLAQLYLKMPMP